MLASLNAQRDLNLCLSVISASKGLYFSLLLLFFIVYSILSPAGKEEHVSQISDFVSLLLWEDLKGVLKFFIKFSEFFKVGGLNISSL